MVNSRYAALIERAYRRLIKDVPESTDRILSGVLKGLRVITLLNIHWINAHYVESNPLFFEYGRR